MHIHDLAPFTDKNFDMSHIINELSFGQPYPGIKNPLNGITVEQKSLQNPSGNTGMFQYFLRVPISTTPILPPLLIERGSPDPVD